MRLRKKMADRKGVAIELALLVLVVAMSMSILLVTTSMLQHSRQLHGTDRMRQSVELEQIGDDFSTNTTKTPAELETELENKFPGYDFSVTDETLEVRAADTAEIMLRVKKTEGIITQWNKS